jgi:hypothetical protein
MFERMFPVAGKAHHVRMPPIHRGAVDITQADQMKVKPPARRPFKSGVKQDTAPGRTCAEKSEGARPCGELTGHSAAQSLGRQAESRTRISPSAQNEPGTRVENAVMSVAQ